MNRPSSIRKSVLIVASIVALSGGGVWLYFSGDVGTTTGPPGGTLRNRPAGSRPWSGLDLPLTEHGSVADLARKVRGGNDRFIVETIHERLEPRLKELATLLSGRRGNKSLAGVLSPDLSATGLRPRKLRVLHESDGIAAFEGAGLDAETRSPESFLEEFRTLFQSVRELHRANLEVIGLEAQGDRVSSTVRYLFAGWDAAGGGRQWNGEAVLVWRRADWRLESWKTVEWFHSRVATPPFRDVSREALGSNPSFDTLLRRSIDYFRSRLDGAIGIEVYGHHGLSAGDADGDGREDLYIPMPAGLPNLLYRARGDGTFEDISERSGTDVLDDTSQALFVDVENDGDSDLVLVTAGGPLLLLNDGEGLFRHREGSFQGTGTAPATTLAASAADYDNDGLVDIYVGSYVFWRGATSSTGSRLPLPYHEAHNGAANFLFRNLGDGRFADVTETAGLSEGNDRFTFAAAWADYDDDGDADLYVANDFGSNNLYRNEGDGTFVDVAAAVGVADVGPGMSVSWEDYDNDGDLDLYVGNMFTSAGRRVTGAEDYGKHQSEIRDVLRRHVRGNSLFRNREESGFQDVSLASRAFFGRWAWGSDFIDINLDGHADIYVQNGFITNTRTHDL